MTCSVCLFFSSPPALTLYRCQVWERQYMYICLSCASSSHWIKSELCVMLMVQLSTSPIGRLILGCTRGGGKVLGSESWASSSWSQEKLLIRVTYVPKWTRKLWKRWMVLVLHWMFLFEFLGCVAPDPFRLHQKLHILWSWPTYRRRCVCFFGVCVCMCQFHFPTV